ncbi:MAG: protoheme IX farnesyltransferase [Candidatus Hodarchaeales archaeon]|jgi:protoheme IX farnesyltransferase
MKKENNNAYSVYPFLPLSIYGDLIKGKQTALLLSTSVFTFLISALQYTFIPFDFLVLIVSMFFAISGSTLLNMYIDKDIDAIMERTKNRPLPIGKILPSTVLKHGIFFTGAGLSISWLFLPFLTTIVIFLGCFFDVVIYSILLKRRTKFSIIFGGIAGGLPAVAGRTAVINNIDIIGILFGLFVICWIPLHILSLSLIPKNLQGYIDAKVPMWPIVSGKHQTMQVITFSALISSLISVIIAILLEIHIILMIPLGFFCAMIIATTIRNFITPTTLRTFKIFKAASIYMILSFFLLFIGLLLTLNIHF